MNSDVENSSTDKSIGNTVKTQKCTKHATGYGSFFKMNSSNLLEQLVVRSDRIKSTALCEKEKWFIENRNVSYSPKRCFGMAVVVHDVSSSKSLFSFGRILESKQRDTGFIYLKLKDNIVLEPYTTNGLKCITSLM